MVMRPFLNNKCWQSLIYSRREPLAARMSATEFKRKEVKLFHVGFSVFQLIYSTAREHYTRMFHGERYSDYCYIVEILRTLNTEQWPPVRPEISLFCLPLLLPGLILSN